MRCTLPPLSINDFNIPNLLSEDAGLHQTCEQVSLLRDHVRQLVHLGLQVRDLLRGLDELLVVLVDILLQLRVRVLGQGLKW